MHDAPSRRNPIHQNETPTVRQKGTSHRGGSVEHGQFTAMTVGNRDVHAGRIHIDRHVQVRPGVEHGVRRQLGREQQHIVGHLNQVRLVKHRPDHRADRGGSVAVRAQAYAAFGPEFRRTMEFRQTMCCIGGHDQ